ncbi:hypothetical protein P8831_09855 [Priestia megaterium]|uniref:hypothetical protein n=1 Tax=Priestia megaterium TaxID=1404 RepID=UPI002D80A89E|nr:hypothetical protein [Priestia megaterium]MEB4869019.1 hypothetical protein [Priestia megaterium]
MSLKRYSQKITISKILMSVDNDEKITVTSGGKKAKDILKSNRKDSGYITANEDDDVATIMVKALLVTQKTIDKKSK